MLVPLSWIQEFVDVTASPDEIAEAFNQLGIEVEGIEAPAADIVGVRVAKVLDVRPHPEADKVRLADVDFGEGPFEVVCGAPKLNPGMVVPYASVGVTLPNGLTLTARNIRGVVSNGMLCSADELGLGGDYSGLLELPTDLPLGSDVGESLGRGEVVFDLSITPNRPDAMCVIGLARELAAHFDLPLKTLDHGPNAIPAASIASEAHPLPSITVEAPDRCPRYLGWRASVTVGPSPEWLAKRLTMAGLRPVNNVVDVTNYVMLERNQPLHAFDFDKVRGIVVRNATAGESITTLDGKARELTTDDLLICDVGGAPQAVAGVMGGLDSEITDNTTELLLEAAYFTSHGVSLTSRRLGLRTDASSRYDRGIDPNAVASAAARAMELLAEVADAKVAPEPVDVTVGEVAPRQLVVRVPRVNALLGTDLGAARMASLLQPLGIEAKLDQQKMTLTIPTFRPDLEREIDIVEEVARRIGYQNIPVTMRSHSFHRGALTPAQQDRRTLADVMVGAGFDEAKAFPLAAPADLEVLGVPADQHITVANPLREEESVLTGSLLPGLLKSVAHNLKQGNRGVALFEMDRVFLPSDEQLPNERVPLTAVVSGVIDERPLGAEHKLDVFTLTRALSNITESLRLADVRLVPTQRAGYENQTAHAIVIDGTECGIVGTLDVKVRKHYGIDAPVAVFELPTEAINAAARKPEESRTVSTQPPSFFDLAFLVDLSVSAERLTEVVTAAGGERIEAARIFDLYAGEHVPDGQKSLALALTVRDNERTLKDKDIQAVRAACIAAAESELGATLRGA